MTVRAIIVDDEPHAREGIRLRLRDYREIRIVGECDSGAGAVEAIDRLKPDLIFLDIQLSDMNGFDVLKRISVSPMPIVIFVTAFDKYAVKAFEFHALDYLLKPIGDERFRETIRTALAESGRRNMEVYAAKLKALQDDFASQLRDPADTSQRDNAAGGYLSRLSIKTRDQITIIPVNEVDWLESAGDYVYIHSNSQKHIIRETLTSLEKKMNPKMFARIHRTTIVNLEKIKSLRPNEHGDYEVFLQDGTKLKLSRIFREGFQRVIGNSI